MSSIPLAEAIQNLRAELSLAMQAGEDQALRFQLGPIELQLEIELARELEGKGGVKWWIIDVGGGAKSKSGSAHKIKLTLEPVTSTGARVHVSDPTATQRPK